MIIIVLLSAYSSSNNKPANQTSSSQNRIPARRYVSYHTPKSYLEVSQMQGKKIQSVIDALMTLEDADMYKIINRLQSFHLKYLERNNIYESDLYDYILKTANERINFAKRNFVKRECGIMVQIITQLKEGISTDDIIRAILPPKEDVVEDEVAVTDAVKSIDDQSNDQQDNGWEVVEDLENHPLRNKEYCRQLHKRVEVLHQNGALDKEIGFILETIQCYESAGLPCKYWQLLLKVRTAEASKKKNTELIAPAVSQIVASLAKNAARQEKELSVEPERYSQSTDISDGPFNKFQLSKQNNDDDICPTEDVPYWEHTYIYSVVDLQKANHQQRQFYRYFKAQFLKERYLDIDDNSNYVFVLMFDLDRKSVV